MTTLTPQEIRTLEQTRQRLSQLHSSLLSLQQHILSSDPLPPWSSLHSLSLITSQSLTSLTTHLSASSPLLQSLTTYPLPTFPGQSQENILQQLLRKKLEPGVEEWVEAGRKGGEEVLGGDGGRREALLEMWEWAGGAANERARAYEWFGDEGGSEEGDEGGDGGEGDGNKGGNEIEEGKGQGWGLEDVLRFMVKGEVPRQGEEGK